MRRHVVVFARAPRLGAVKRRLAAGVGALAALRFHRVTAAALLRRLAADRRWTCHLALTPDAARPPPDWPRGLRRRAQGRGDLGERMARVLAGLPKGPAVIVGSDIPALTPRHVAAAFAALGRHDVVFGPAADGGYWLVGVARRPGRRLFCGVRWSSPTALADTVANCRRRRVALLETLEDVDDADGYRRWRHRKDGVNGT